MSVGIKHLAQRPVSSSLQKTEELPSQSWGVKRLGCAPALDPMDRLLLEGGSSAQWAAVLSSCFSLHSQGLKKISAYMKSSRFLPAPMFAKLAHWNSK